VINPPWGQRVGRDNTTPIMRSLGDALRERWSGWRVAILAPNARMVSATKLSMEKELDFKSGGINVGLYLGAVW
jgi:23S rRNA G2445 N2-methylase RlmL